MSEVAACAASERLAGRVLEVGTNGAWVEVREVRTGCGRCHEPGGCGGVSLIRWRPRRVWLSASQLPPSLQVGETLWLEVPAGVPLKAAWRIYGAPLLLGIAVAAAVRGLASGPAAEVAALAALVATLLAGWWWSGRRARPWVRAVRVESTSNLR